ncbi:MAG: GPW/gp25 family protein [Myxococcales bacterium]|nr:GPW/gp25 family protein [Myxococcales bacterium]
MSFLNRFLESPPQDDELQSVMRNLQNLLCARPGYSSRLIQYGVADYLAQQGNKGAQLSILREIEDVIFRLESRLRLRDLSCKGRDAELRLHIHLRGSLKTRKGAVPCQLKILFHLCSGDVQIEPDTEREVRRGA